MIDLLLATALALTPHTTTGNPSHDAAAVQQIELCGHHFAEHRLGKIDYFVFFPTLKGAIDTAASLNEEMFVAEVKTAAARPGWLVYARYRKLPTLEQLQTGDALLEALATEHAGEYNGHACATVPYPRSEA